jgi:DNA-binding NarL/FixJ family response regulator
VIRVVIVDDHQLVREGLASLLRSARDIVVVGLAGSGAEGAALVLKLAPDVVLLDLSMPEVDGLGVLERLRKAGSAARAIILTTFDDDTAMLRAAVMGAAGFLLKDLPREELEDAIRSVHGGAKVFRPTMSSAIRETPRLRRPDADRGQAIAPLTERELAVLRLMAGGLSNKEVAIALHLAEGTVKNHVSAILDKFGVTDRTRAVLKAIERRML